MKFLTDVGDKLVPCEVETFGKYEVNIKLEPDINITLRNPEILFTPRYITMTGYMPMGINDYRLTGIDLYPMTARKV